MTDGRSFLRNSTWNLLGLAIPLALALVAIPVLVRGLGAERFGILTLAWAAVGYFSLFEFGLSRALTQAVAQRLGRGDAAGLSGLVWPALLLLFGLGIVGAVVLIALARTAVTHWLNVPAELHSEAVRSFYIIGASLPLVLLSVGLRGQMEAHQHFGVVNALRIPLGSFTFIGPLLTLPFSRSLVPAMWMLLAGRAVGFAAHAIICVGRYEYLRRVEPIRWSALAPLLRFGAWTTVTSIVSPLMVQMDRFFIATVLPLAAVTAYVTPFEVMTKFMVIPESVVTAAFPAFAATLAANPGRLASLYGRSQRMVIALLFPVVLAAIALAHEGLALWLRNSLPAESGTVLQVLALGMFINSLAHTPYVALQGAGRADLIARLHMVELPIYAAALWYFTQAWGLVGVAAAWTLRVSVDTTALVLLARRMLGLPKPGRMVVPGTLALIAALAAGVLPGSTGARIAYTFLGATAFLAIAWRRLLSPTERAGLVTLLQTRGRVADSTAGAA